MKTPDVTISFDASLNPVTQTFQIDLNVTYWDIQTDRVKVWNWDSRFLGNIVHNYLLSEFSSATEKPNLK